MNETYKETGPYVNKHLKDEVKPISPLGDMTETDIKKYLYKNSDVQVNFRRYKFGKLYFTVKIEEHLYEFPMSVVEETKFITCDSTAPAFAYQVAKEEDLSGYQKNKWEDVNVLNLHSPNDEVTTVRLSSDMGDVNFFSGDPAKLYIRWITKAFKSGELIKVG